MRNLLKCTSNCSIQNWSQRKMFCQWMCTVTPILCRAICIERDLLERSSKPQLQHPFFLSVKKKTEERKQNSIHMVLNRLWKNTHWQRWCWIVHSRKKCIRPKENKNPNPEKIPPDVQRQTQQMHAEKKGDPKNKVALLRKKKKKKSAHLLSWVTSIVVSKRQLTVKLQVDFPTASERSVDELAIDCSYGDRASQMG